jgi:hypothetical protein
VPALHDILGADGLLARGLNGFAYRPQQLEMAERVAETLAKGGVLITEAGTGTGKTFAYLVPALLSGRKVIVSTGTKNLQDQLFNKDLPRVRDLLSLPVKVALLKGRANYLCPHRLQLALDEGRFHSRELVHQLQQVRKWAKKTRRGDIAEIADLPEDAAIWPYVTSTNDNCLGQECPAIQECPLVEARRRAQEAELVVVNHYLLCADFALKDGGFGELLPAADAFILDEAHQLPEVASNFFGLTVSGRQLLELARDTVQEYHKEAGDMKEIPQHADALEKATKDLRLAFGVEERRGSWNEVASSRGSLRPSARCGRRWASSGNCYRRCGSGARGWRAAPTAAAPWPAISPPCATAAGRERSAGSRPCARASGSTRPRWRSITSSAASWNAGPELDLHLRHPGGGSQLSPLSGPVGAGRGRHRPMGEPLRLPQSGPLVRPSGVAAPQRSPLHRGGAGDRHPGAGGQPRARLPPLHQPPRPAHRRRHPR